MINTKQALVVVDMQNYYIKQESGFSRYYESISPGCMAYIASRCDKTVIPNIAQLISAFRKRSREIIYLRLCGTDPERKDLHRFFRDSWEQGREAGFNDIYPLSETPMSMVVNPIAPVEGDAVFTKTTFSAFTSTKLDDYLKKRGIAELVFTGLATSQCVETTARDASDRGYGVTHIEDAQADYDELTHNSSLYSSRGVCGGGIWITKDYLNREDIIPGL